MRSFSDVEVLIVVLFVVALCVLLNLQTTYTMAGWVCQKGLMLVQQAAALVR